MLILPPSVLPCASRGAGRGQLSRRDWMRLATLGVLGTGGSGWLPRLAAAMQSQHPRQPRHCVILWMPGGPSQLDTFDMKPGTAEGGEFQEIATRVPGMRFSEHLPQLAELAEHLAIVRGLHTREGDHERGTYLVRTGQRMGGPLKYPSIGSALAQQLGNNENELPQYVSVAPSEQLNPNAFGSGFLGPRYAPATVSGARGGEAVARGPDSGAEATGFARLALDFLKPSAEIGTERIGGRAELWNHLQNRFLATHAAANADAHDTLYRRAMRLASSPAASAFDLAKEDDAVRERYGRGLFGQGCLLARRLIESGVPLVEVALTGNSPLAWDTHANNFDGVRDLSTQLDQGWSALMRDLKDRGLLELTTFLWIGEFGRTPRINDMAGRDHFPDAWTCVFAGAGIQGGAVHGKTSENGMEVVEDQVAIGDVLATLCAALGVDPQHENLTDIGRPIKITEGQPIRRLLA